MNPLMIKGLAGLALAASLIAGYSAWHHHVFAQGEESKKAEWDAAENAAILKRTAENAAMAETQAETNRLITRSKDAELTKIRDAYSAAGRLRIPATVCSGSAGRPETSGTSGGNAASAGTVALPEQTERDLRTLMQEADTIVAGCRAAQEFIRANGMAP